MTRFAKFTAPALFILLLWTGAFADDDAFVWRPVSAEELAMKTPIVEADADAEAIFWDIELDDKKRKKLFYTHYVRVKIFTERGREKFSKFDIPFGKGKKVEDVAARVIKPDGTIIELKPTDIFERDILQYGKIKVRAKSFAVPGIEPGVIVEYRYKETFKGDSADGERLFFQRDIPMQSATYSIRPFTGSPLEFEFHNMKPVNFQADGEGFHVATRLNIPAFKSEPQMPPDEETRAWLGLHYRASNFSWSYFGGAVGRAFGAITKENKEVQQKAAELTANARSDDEKLQRIYDFTQKQIRNLTFDRTITNEQRENTKMKDSAEVLRRSMGTFGDINFLFAALARAAGFEADWAFSADRSESFFNPENDLSGSYLHPAAIGVKVNGVKRFFNPGIPYLPYGKLFWYEEGVYAMLANEAGYFWQKTPLTDYKESPAKRTGKFKLLEDGTLEGTVKIEYKGQQAISRRQEEFKNSPAQREENVKEEIKQRMSTAEISALSIENFDDSSKPLTYIFKVRVPNYAQKTGKRLFLQPSFFEYGTKPVFSSATRIHPIYFNYPWSEEDEIEIEYPKGFALENAESPGDVIEPGRLTELSFNLFTEKGGNSIKVKRKFFFGAKGNILFPVASYETLKGLFDNFHKTDMYTVTLRQSE